MDDLASMFCEYKSSPLFSKFIRDKIVVSNMPLVASVAKKIKDRLPPHVDIEDLISVGAIGLMQAVDRFEPERGNKFSTFATFLIKGRIYDYLRQVDWAPRSVRQTIKKINEAESVLNEELSRCPCAFEVADKLGMTEKAVSTLKIRDAQITISLSDSCSNGGPGFPLTIGDTIPDTKLCNPEDGVARAELVSSVLRLAGYRDGLVLNMYHLEGLSMSQVAKVMGLSEGRISQINKRALASVREVAEEAWHD